MSTKPARKRRTLESAEAEILDAARELLAERGFQAFTVSAVMDGTSMQRSAFYHYFSDRYALIRRLLLLIENEIMDRADVWLADEEGGPLLLGKALDSTLQFYFLNGHVLSAAHSASLQDEETQRFYRGTVIQDFIDAVALRISAENRAGKTSVANPEMVAEALVLMKVSMMLELVVGEAEGSLESVSDTIRLIWTRAIYG